MNREGDVVLIYYQGQPTMYARIEAIEADIKKDWYRVDLLLLSIPPQNVTWILREEYIQGAPFTMGGNSMALEAVKGNFSESQEEGKGKSSEQKAKGKEGKVIPLKKPHG